MYRHIKSLAAFLGGLTPISVVGALALFKVNVPVDQVAAWLLVGTPLLSTLATWFAPANAPKPETEVLPPAWTGGPVEEPHSGV